MIRLIVVIWMASMAFGPASASLDFFRPELDVASHYWANRAGLNASLSMGCTHCGESFYHEPPPDDILFIPSPPLHPSFEASLANLYEKSLKSEEQCSFCEVFHSERQQLSEFATNQESGGILSSLLIIVSISLVLYLLATRQTKIFALLTKTNIFQAHDQSESSGDSSDKENSRPRLTEPCYFTSPIISDTVSHKKTSIPSKCWAQPGTVTARVAGRVPNEYEVPSTRTNSIGPSSVFYADTNNHISPYNMHTYAEIHYNPIQSYYERPPQRAHIIVTSNNQGVNPALLSSQDQIHNVI